MEIRDHQQFAVYCSIELCDQRVSVSRLHSHINHSRFTVSLTLTQSSTLLFTIYLQSIDKNLSPLFWWISSESLSQAALTSKRCQSVFVCVECTRNAPEISMRINNKRFLIVTIEARCARSSSTLGWVCSVAISQLIYVCSWSVLILVWIFMIGWCLSIRCSRRHKDVKFVYRIYRLIDLLLLWLFVKF